MTDQVESKEDKFKRLSEPRLNNALAKLKIIGNLTGSGYAFNSQQAGHVLGALKAAVADLEAKFQKGLKRQGHSDTV